MDDRRVFIDRNPKIFGQVLDYLRSNRKIVPKEAIMDINLFKNEINHWGLDRDRILEKIL